MDGLQRLDWELAQVPDTYTVTRRDDKNGTVRVWVTSRQRTPGGRDRLEVHGTPRRVADAVAWWRSRPSRSREEQA